MKPWPGLILLVLLFTGVLRADDAPAPVTNPAQISRHYQQVTTEPQFQEAAEPDVNTRFREWLTDWFRHFGVKLGEFKYASRMPAFESMLMTLLVVLCVLGLIYTMARLTRRHLRFEREPRPETGASKTFRAPEFYEEEIRKALAARDWHAAWLASWRQFLSRLENRDLVEADRTRTNREYLAQLTARSLPATAQTLLTGLVDAYDRFIYGKRPIAENDWQLFQRQIGEASLLLSLDDKPARPAGGVS